MNILVFRYNISFIDPERGGFGEIFPEVITSGNISPNPPRSGSINDKYRMAITSVIIFRKEIQYFY